LLEAQRAGRLSCWRLGLESTYRRLALQSPVGAERIALVDRANELRPRTVL